MNDRELADKIVALGVGESVSSLFFLSGAHNEPVDAEFFVRDWRVAGALMEKCIEQKIHLVPIMKSATVRLVKIGSLPRAIIEACVEALS